MSGTTIGVFALLVLAAVLTPMGERVVNWLIPRRLNYRIAAVAARFAVRLARTEAGRQEAKDALANVLAESTDSRDISPLATVAPVLVRCLRGQFRWHRVKRGYVQTNWKGVTYYLNTKTVTLSGHNRQTIYFFSKRWRAMTACDLPRDRRVNENPRNGFLSLARKDRCPDPQITGQAKVSLDERSVLQFEQHCGQPAASLSARTQSHQSSMSNEVTRIDSLPERAKSV